MKILEFLQENNGQFSSQRLFSFLITFAIVTDYMHAVFTVGVWNPSLDLIGLFLIVLGNQTVGKLYEKKYLGAQNA